MSKDTIKQCSNEIHVFNSRANNAQIRGIQCLTGSEAFFLRDLGQSKCSRTVETPKGKEGMTG